MRLLFIIIIYAGLWSCSKTTDTKSSVNHTDSLVTTNTNSTTVDSVTNTDFDYEGLFKLESYIANNVTGDSKPEIIDFDCAILIYPTDEQIEEMKKTEGEENFYIGADDSNWYQAMAIEMMDSVGIKQISTLGQYLRLKGKNKTWDLDIRKKNMPAWNLIFFKRTKEPQIISTVDLTTEEVREYFEIAK